MEPPSSGEAPLFSFLNIRDKRDGQAGNHQDQARQFSRHRLFLCDQEEPAQPDREDVVPQVRPGRAQARRVQGSQDQVSGSWAEASPGPFATLLSAGTPADSSSSLTDSTNRTTEIGLDT